MRTRLSVIGLGLCAGLLAACGGGSSSAVGPLQAPTPTPTPMPTNDSSRPHASGDAFAYAGTMTETFVRPPLPAGAVTPNPNPTDMETIDTAVSQAITVGAPATFNGVSTAYDYKTVETDSVDNGLETTVLSSDEFYTFTSAGASTDVTFIGSKTTDSDGNRFNTEIGAGNGLVDVLPETAGPIVPANTAAKSDHEIDADGTTSGQTVAANGSYTESGADAIGVPTATTVNADGSGSYTFPLIVPADSTYTVSAPAPGPSAGPEQIGIVLSVPDELVNNDPAPNATPFAIQEGPVDVWYPTPIALSHQTLTDNGTVALPAACNVPASLTRTANQTVQATTTVDPVFGETDVNTMTAYTEPGIGVACLTLNDVVTQYYDLSGQTQASTEGLLGFFSTPLQITTTAETLGITSATVLGLSSAGRSPQLALRASTAHFRAVLAKHRAARHREFYRALVARSKGGHR